MSNVVNSTKSEASLIIVDHSNAPSSAHEQEVNDLFEFLRIEETKYTQYKVVCDSLEEYVREDDGQEEVLKHKIRDIVLGKNVAQTVVLDPNTVDINIATVLGVHDNLNTSTINYSERNKLVEILKLKLDKKCENVRDYFYDLTNSDIDITVDSIPSHSLSRIQMPPEDKSLLKCKNELVLEQEQYVKNLCELEQLLRELTELRVETLPKITEQKTRELQTEQRINSLKAAVCKKKYSVDIFKETSCTMDAYKELIADIKNQQQDCREEILKLNELKDQYKQVSCKQYEELLQSYLQYKTRIEQRKIIYSYKKS